MSIKALSYIGHTKGLQTVQCKVLTPKTSICIDLKKVLGENGRGKDMSKCSDSDTRHHQQNLVKSRKLRWSKSGPQLGLVELRG